MKKDTLRKMVSQLWDLIITGKLDISKEQDHTIKSFEKLRDKSFEEALEIIDKDVVLRNLCISVYEPWRGYPGMKKCKDCGKETSEEEYRRNSGLCGMCKDDD